MARGDKGQGNGFVQALALLTQIGFTIVACVAIGIFLGWLLDRWLGTEPWLLMVFTLLGIVAAIKSIIEFAKKV